LYYKTDTLTTPTTFLRNVKKAIGGYIKGRREYMLLFLVERTVYKRQVYHLLVIDYLTMKISSGNL